MMKEMEEKFNEVRKVTIGVPRDRGQNTPREFTPTAGQWVGQARRYTSSRLTAPGPNERSLLENGEKMMNEAMEIVNNFFENEWPKFEEAYKNTDMNFFKDFSDPIKK